MSRLPAKGRVASGRGFRSPAPGASAGFGAFSSTSSTKLSYLTEPPDFSAIDDANVGVSFKNLLKKDSTTKSRALEDIVAHVRAHPFEQDGGVEEPILDAWVQLYPRASIDNSRRVRELSHNVQFELMKSARKRMEKRVPKIVATWLAGTFDKDRVVSRAASEGLSSFLNTDEKVAQFWKKCQAQILEYATDAIKETPETLSDERSTTSEDAEAKYYRVVGGCLSLVLGLLRRIDDASQAGLQESYDAFFSLDKVWNCSSAADPYVRKTVYQLLSACLEKQPESIKAQSAKLSRIFVSEGLRSSQTGSATEYVRILEKLTQVYPDVWGSKKSPYHRLQRFLERGSQGGSAQFWIHLDRLLAIVPSATLTVELATEVLKAMRTGISSREEPRSNLMEAWSCYARTISRFLEQFSADHSVKLVQENLFPLLDHYLHPPSERSQWTSGGHVLIPAKAHHIAARSSHEQVRKATHDEWSRLADIFISKISNPLPETSREYRKSQQAVADEGTRWFTLVASILDGTPAHQTSDTQVDDSMQFLTAPSTKVLHSSLSKLKETQYRLFGAACTIESATKRAPRLFLPDGHYPILDDIEWEKDAATILSSPPSLRIMLAIQALAEIVGECEKFKSVWTIIVDSLLSNPPQEFARALVPLISNQGSAALARDYDPLQSFLEMKCSECARGTTDSWSLFEAVLAFDALAPTTLKGLLTSVIDQLGMSSSAISSLKALEIIAHRKPVLLSDDSATQLDLVTKLLGMTEISDPSISTRATALRRLLEKTTEGNSSPLQGIIHQNLDHAGPHSLEVGTLVQQAVQLHQSNTVEMEELFPNTNIWMKELALFLEGVPNPDLSLTGNLGGAYFLPQKVALTTASARPRRDRMGRSIPARMALYTTKLLNSDLGLNTLPEKFQLELLYSLYLTIELAVDQPTDLTNHQLWANLGTTEGDSEVDEFVSSSRLALKEALAEKPGDALIDQLVEMMVSQTKELTSPALYTAKALSELVQGVVDARGYPSGEPRWLSGFGQLKASPSTVMAAVAFLAGYGEAAAGSKAVSNLCNRLISDIAGASANSEQTLLTLVLLNATIAVYETGELPVANNRLVFAVRQLTSWLEEPDEIGSNLAAEICRSLQRLLPCVKDVYGPYWERTIEFCIYLWNRAERDGRHARWSYIHASLKLVSVLERLEEPNDDLEDALKSLAEDRSLALIELLKLDREGASQPVQIIDAILRRKVEKIPLEHVSDLSDLYYLLANESSDIQTAAFSLLHRAIPAAQEALSMDILLDKTEGHLPYELLSLLLDPPTLERFPEPETFAPEVRAYLLAWHLVFDALGAASHKLRGDYTEELKRAGHVPPLLEFTFDMLGHSAAHPLNLDREGLADEAHLRGYDVDLAEAEPDEKSLHWLLVHLFFQTLRHLSGLFRAWFLDCRRKQTKIAVEAWMARYFAPAIIADTLDEVQAWAGTQQTTMGDDDDGKELIVRISRAAKEVTAGYEVDELQATIVVHIPAAYPLEGVKVEGTSRVAVSERTWQAWLRSTQGVITFSNGSITDGLTAFRRNVTGALKGHTECAICYSIISTDKRTPDKKCSTCKNFFHRTCLYKWFTTSSQNTCPLCRNPIDYLGSDTKRRAG